LAALAAGAVGYGVSKPLHASHHKRAALAVLAFAPLFSLLVYLSIGNPDSPDAPLAPRLDGTLEELPPGAVIAKLEQRLRDAPDDTTGWLLMARLRMTIEDYPKAADSWQRLLALDGDNSEAMVGLAQALIEQDGGVVSAAAVDLLDRALALEPENFAARFWRAEAHDQLGETKQARALWRRMRDKLPDNMPLAKMLDRRLAP
jgi:cytochrome c-type biogenesis protein CcmH